MSKYRIYALIHGETIPEGKIFDCEIKKMTFEEQAKRKFAPIKGVFSKGELADYHKTYVTSLSYIDPLKIKSGYAIIHEIEEDRPGDAIGGAIKAIDRVTRLLSLACLEDIKKEFGENRGSFQPYIYQVNKIYLLNEKGEEIKVNYQPKSGHIYLPDRPSSTKWRNSETVRFLEEMERFYDPTLEKAIKYLYRSSIGFLLLDSREKIALDHFKSIEIIVDSLSNKDFFKERLDEAAIKISIVPEAKERIVNFYDQRSNGDVAHSSSLDPAEMYPNQFPIPSNVQYSGGFLDEIAGNIVLKYYKYIKGIFTIDVDEPSTEKLGPSEGSFGRVYMIFPIGASSPNHLAFYTTEKDKNRLKSKLKKAFAQHFKVPIDSIVEVIPMPKDNSPLHTKRFKLRVCTTI